MRGDQQLQCGTVRSKEYLAVFREGTQRQRIRRLESVRQGMHFSLRLLAWHLLTNTFSCCTPPVVQLYYGTSAVQYREAFYRDIPPMVASGQIKYTEDRSTGLESVGEAILSVQKGTNTGKKVIIVADD